MRFCATSQKKGQSFLVNSAAPVNATAPETPETRFILNKKIGVMGAETISSRTTVYHNSEPEGNAMKDTLLKDLEAKNTRERKWGWMNYGLAYTTAIVTLLGSIGGSLLAVLSANQALNAIIAAIPAVALSVNQIFHFERRAFFHWKKHWKCQSLIWELKYQKKSVEETSKNFTRMDLDMLGEWIPFYKDEGSETTNASVSTPAQNQ
jgi:hypothetical protein